MTLVSRSTVRKEFTPVFGTGVVFYTSGAEVKGAMLWGFPGEATAAAAALSKNDHSTARPAAGAAGGEESAADAAAGISARALDLLRTIMERSANMDADLSDERVMQAWVQGLSDAARVVAQETGVGHLQPMRRFGGSSLVVSFPSCTPSWRCRRLASTMRVYVCAVVLAWHIRCFRRARTTIEYAASPPSFHHTTRGQKYGVNCFDPTPPLLLQP